MSYADCFLPENNRDPNLLGYSRTREAKFFLNHPNIEHKDINDKLGSLGDFEELFGINAIIRNILSDLRIQKGTYIMDPKFGTGIHTYIFKPKDMITQEEIEFGINNILEYYREFVEMSYDISFFQEDHGYRISITIDYDGKTQNFDIDMDTSVIKQVDV